MMRSPSRLAFLLSIVAASLVADSAAAQSWPQYPNGPPDTRLEAPELFDPAAPGPTPPALDPDKTLEDPPPAHFGDDGAFVLTGNTVMGLRSTTYSDSDRSSLAVTFSPAFDYFFARDLTIGLVFPTAYRHQRSEAGESSRTSYGIGVRLGDNVRLGDRFSLFLQWSMAYDHNLTKREPTGAAASRYSDDGFSMDLAAPVLFHVTPHLFAGFGPTLHHDFSRKIEHTDAGYERTTIGASLVVGCWF